MLRPISSEGAWRLDRGKELGISQIRLVMFSSIESTYGMAAGKRAMRP